MFIKQISIFLENNPGALREMTELLGKGGIDLLALSLADTQSFGIVRAIVHSDQIDTAMDLLKGAGYIARVNHVICASVPDRPLGLCELLAVIEQAGLSVEYMYSTESPALSITPSRADSPRGRSGTEAQITWFTRAI